MIHRTTPKSYQLPDHVKNRLLGALRTRGDDRDSGAATTDTVDVPDFFPLRAAIANANRLGLLMGEQPPRPPTRRAHVSAVLIRLIRRALFWYTPQIVRMHVATIAALEEQMNVSMQVVRILQQALLTASSNERFVLAHTKEISRLVLRVDAMIHDQREISVGHLRATHSTEAMVTRLEELESEVRELNRTIRGRARGNVG